MKGFIKVFLILAAAAGLAYAIYRLLERLYPQAVKRYYSPAGSDDICSAD